MQQAILAAREPCCPPSSRTAALREALADDDVDVVAKDLEVYAPSEPPARLFARQRDRGVAQRGRRSRVRALSTLVGYSAAEPARRRSRPATATACSSLALLEPAWVGTRARSSEEQRALRAELNGARDLPAEQILPQVRSPPARGRNRAAAPAGRPTAAVDGQASRRGCRALMDVLRATTGSTRDRPASRSATRSTMRSALAATPTLTPGWPNELGELFADFTLEVYDDRHHFDPPHRVEPERLAARLRQLWEASTRATWGSAGP